MRPPGRGLDIVLLVGLPFEGHHLVLKLGVHPLCVQKHIVKLGHVIMNAYKHILLKKSVDTVLSDCLLKVAACC